MSISRNAFLLRCVLVALRLEWVRGDSGSAAANFEKGAPFEFVQELTMAPRGTRGIVFHIGANHGNWIRSWGEAQSPSFRHEGKPLDLIYFEPQPMFRPRLMELASQINATFIPATAWKKDGYVNIRSSHSGFTSATAAVEKGRRQNSTSVRSIDLAAFINRHLPKVNDGDVVSLMKLDVDGAEYDLLPWLLAEGALCRVRYLIIGWHLNKVPPHERLSALGLRLSFHHLLEAGCRSPPALIDHDEPVNSNFYGTVPGLSELAERYSAYPERAGRHKREHDHDHPHEHDAACDRGPRCGVAAGTNETCRWERMACSTADAQVEMEISKRRAKEWNDCFELQGPSKASKFKSRKNQTREIS